MKLTFLGHASWLIESAKATIVTDLLVENFFRNGTFTICPTRRFDFEAMPRVDALIISHRHRDHFDLETLLRLDRRTRILCPRDGTILHALDRLGFTDIEQFSDWTHHTVADLELIFTPSENRVPEHGVLVTEGETVFWNQVDTVISAQTIEIIRDQVGLIDLVAHGYQPMLETAALESLGTQFPTSAYAAILHRAKLLAPRALVPGSNGYRTTGAHAWFNAYKFPVSRERFVQDVARMLPQTETFIPNPGDVMVLGPEGMKTARQAAANGFVQTPVDDAAMLMSFDPSTARPPLTDDNASGIPSKELRRMTRALFEERFPAGCKAKITRFHSLRMLGASVEFRVIYPDDDNETWTLDLSGELPKVGLGRRGDDTDFVMVIAASTLHDLATGRTRPDVVALSGQFRSFARAYRIEGGRVVGSGDVAPPGVHRQRSAPPWLLFTLMGFEPDFETRQVDAELDRLLGESAERSVPLWERPAPRALPRRLSSPPPAMRAPFAPAPLADIATPERVDEGGPAEASIPAAKPGASHASLLS